MWYIIDLHVFPTRPDISELETWVAQKELNIINLTKINIQSSKSGRLEFIFSIHCCSIRPPEFRIQDPQIRTIFHCCLVARNYTVSREQILRLTAQVTPLLGREIYIRLKAGKSVILCMSSKDNSLSNWILVTCKTSWGDTTMNIEESLNQNTGRLANGAR